MIEGQWLWGVRQRLFPLLPQPRPCPALTNLPSLLSPGSSRTDGMGSACIKVTKYFLFLFNLLFFVSMTRAPHGLRKRLSSWGHPSARPSSLGLVVGWGLRQTIGNGSRWGWKEIPSVPSWRGGRTLGPCPSLSLPRSSAEASGATRAGGGRGESGIFLVRS